MPALENLKGYRQVLVESYALGVNVYSGKPVAFEAFAKEVAGMGDYCLLANKVPA